MSEGTKIFSPQEEIEALKRRVAMLEQQVNAMLRRAEREGRNP